MPWKPNPGGQTDFANDFSHYCVAMIGGRDSGKTFAGARKFLEIHLINAFDNGMLTGTDSLVVSPTFQTANTVDIPELFTAMKEMGIEYTFIWDKTKFWFEIPCLSTPTDPSRIYVRTAESPDSIVGFSTPNVWGDEPATWRSDVSNPINDPMSQIFGRMRGGMRPGLITQINLTGTHEGDRTRLYEEFEANAANAETHKMYRVPTSENPAAMAFVEQQKKILGEDEAKQYLLGIALHTGEGKAFPTFDKNIHVKPTPYNPKLAICWCLDFNVDPYVTTVCQHKDGEVYCIAVLEKRNTNTEEMCEIFFDTAKERGWDLGGVGLWGDPSGDHRETVADKGHTDWRIVRNAFERRGIEYRYNVPMSHSDRLSTLNAVRAKLKSADGQNHISIDPSCKRLIDDLLYASWPGDLEENHALASFRYFVNREWPIRFEPTKSPATTVGFGTGYKIPVYQANNGPYVGFASGYRPAPRER